MKVRTLLLSSVALIACLAAPAVSLAESISITSGTVTASDPLQTGRLVRNGTPQSWVGAETFPGENNPLHQYNYTTYQFASSLFYGAPYVEITFDDPNAVYFISAYSGAYNPAFGAKSTNWLGDEGFTGNYFGTVPSYFQVILPAGDNLDLVINDTTLDASGLGSPFTFTVDAFSDTNYDAPVPEPSSIALLGTGLLGAVSVVRRRLR